MEYKESLVEFLTQDKPDMSNRTLVAWGTGNTAQLYYEGFKRLEREGFVISFYTDSKWGGGVKA